jgi:hypothetical protein
VLVREGPAHEDEHVAAEVAGWVVGVEGDGGVGGVGGGGASHGDLRCHFAVVDGFVGVG